MYKHILIATDGSELAEKAVTTGLTLAKGLGAKATAITVSEPWAIARTCHGAVAVPFDAYENAAAETASKALASVGRLAAADTVIATADHIVPVGVIAPDHVVTPAALIDYLVANR